jgi:hypothetical protein
MLRRSEESVYEVGSIVLVPHILSEFAEALSEGGTERVEAIESLG